MTWAPPAPPFSHPTTCTPACLPARLQGLAFVTQRKAGLVAGYNWGSGFAIQRQPDGSWSAPCFLIMRYGSLGLTLGMQTIQSCHLLQVRGLLHGQGVCRGAAAHSQPVGSQLAGRDVDIISTPAQLLPPLPPLLPLLLLLPQTAEQVRAFTCDQAGVTVDATLMLGLDPYDLDKPLKPIRWVRLQEPLCCPAAAPVPPAPAARLLCCGRLR